MKQILMPNNFDIKTLKWLLLLAAVSFVPALFFYYVGEEGIYAITSLEMWHQGVWLQEIMYGQDNQRPPLMNWLVFPVAEALGWNNVSIAIRSVSVMATLGTAAWLGVLAHKLSRDKTYALFVVLNYLALADLALYRGWLSYTDPTFTFFAFGAIAALWIASVERKYGWLLVAIVMLTGALMTKALTSYIFYGISALVLMAEPVRRKFLLSIASLSIHALALILFVSWFAITPHGEGHGMTMLDEILRKFSAQGFLPYFEHFVRFPIEVALGWCPPLLLAVYFSLKNRGSPDVTHVAEYKVAAWIVILNLLPYWLAPQSGIRYLMPIYPVVALASAGWIWRCGERAKLTALRWFSGLIALKFIMFLIVFPYYQQHYRGHNYQLAAQDVMQITQGKKLYVDDVRSVGLSITAYIDSARYPLTPLFMPPAIWDDGYLLTARSQSESDTLVQTYTLAGDQTYLYCRGSACRGAKQP